MKGTRIPSTRRLVGEFSRTIGKETLHIRFYEDLNGFVCERELVERDGTSFVQTLPFTHARQVREFFQADPYYSLLMVDIDKIVARLGLEKDNGSGHNLP